MQCRRLIGLNTLLLMGLLSGCSLFNREQDVVKVSPLPIVVNQFKLNQVWKQTVGQGVGSFYSRLQPAYQAGRVYVADRQGRVAALSAAKGEVIWQVKLSAPLNKRSALLSGGITLAGEQLLLSSENAEVLALQVADGTLLWRQTVGGEVISRPLVDQGLVLVHTNNGLLEALDQQSGQPRWQQSLDIPVLSLRGSSNPVASSEGIMVVGGKNGRVNALSLEQGELLWQQQIAQPTGTTEIDRLNDVAATPVIIDNRVLALSYHGTLSALALHSGQVMWQRPISSASDFIVVGQQLYLVDQADNVIAVDSRSGVELWRQSALRHRQLTSPTLYQGALVVGDAQGYLHGISLEEGQLVAQQKLDSSGFYSAAIVAGDRLVVQARKGALYLLSRQVVE
ncbi:outer membrane protein assembly factor BamB [unidentified bacterial endosymbiont]|uniref:outer membrane protein assembly factor BamB n=1 Tax=unidentified bacterial endosymbiont TaxID=2355 RepID=UPI00209DFB09|nr:outer membrane protein assembly factor BamB [unidentified bacterial endosymbiont]